MEIEASSKEKIQKVINELRNTKQYSELFNDVQFIEYLYATLTAWGMHRMGPNTKMAEFDEFKESIIKNKQKFVQLSQMKIRTINLEHSKNDILTIFNSLKIMKRDEAPKLVANSKIMHFLLPDLIPPMDREYTLSFFYNNKNLPKIGQDEIFLKILLKFQEIANKLNLNEKDLKNPWDTSIPKIIDNAIIGFNISH